jgi:hypothetical protein
MAKSHILTKNREGYIIEKESDIETCGVMWQQHEPCWSDGEEIHT